LTIAKIAGLEDTLPASRIGSIGSVIY